MSHNIWTTSAQAREQGYVETVFGRRLWLPEINSPNGPRRQAAERAAINAPMQGTAADIIKLSMIEVENWLENEQLESKLIMQVHDELVLEVPDKELDIVRKKLPELMGSVARLKVPLIAEVGFGKTGMKHTDLFSSCFLRQRFSGFFVSFQSRSHFAADIEKSRRNTTAQNDNDTQPTHPSKEIFPYQNSPYAGKNNT